MAKKTKFRTSMISNSQKAATGMLASPIGPQLQANGFTSATMQQAATDLTSLQSKSAAAHSAWLAASAALSAKAEEFDQTWSSYCNIVRGLTPDTTVRKSHGVPSPGVRKGPTFKRGPRKTATTEATAPTAPAAATATTPAKP
ncbi:MAG TPA: hypothetical protein VGG39_29865 [Polyangiaceae bacterium]|jgi:hypothetical protein